MEIKLDIPDGTAREEKIRFGEIIRIPLGVDEEAHIEIDAKRGMDVGMGPGRDVKTVVHGGVVGLVIDARGRPIIQPEDPEERKTKLQGWFRSLEMYD